MVLSPTADDSGDGVSRAVISGAFAVLTSLSGLGSARVSDLQRDTGLPRTTVHRLLAQLEQLGAVERSSGHWSLGPAMVRLGAAVPAEPRLRSVARRPLMDLASATGEIVALSVEMAGEGMVIDVAIVAPDISCVAAPLRLAHGGVGAVWMMILGGAPISAPFVAATRRTAGRIASQLSRPFLAAQRSSERELRAF